MGKIPPNRPSFIGLSIINHPFWGIYPIFGNIHMVNICRLSHDLQDLSGFHTSKRWLALGFLNKINGFPLLSGSKNTFKKISQQVIVTERVLSLCQASCFSCCWQKSGQTLSYKSNWATEMPNALEILGSEQKHKGEFTHNKLTSGEVEVESQKCAPNVYQMAHFVRIAHNLLKSMNINK